MIRLATVFSGIGAIEHALDRMELDHEIVFACDNGDVDILSKKIDDDLDEIQTELTSLEELIKRIQIKEEEDEYKAQLDTMLNAAKAEYKKALDTIDGISEEHVTELILYVLDAILKMTEVKKERHKEYKGFSDKLRRKGSRQTTLLKSFQCILEVVNDYKKDNAIGDLGRESVQYNSTDNIEWSGVSTHLKMAYDILEANAGKKIIKSVKDLSQRTSMLHEKINAMHVLRELAQIDDYAEKKKYVDRLYSGKEAQNKVKASYMANYKVSEENFHWNVCFLDGKQYRDKVDLFVGGSPCQSFSLVGKQRGLEDTRGTLFYEYARLISEIKPKVFIYENVKAVMSNDDGKTWETMSEVFTQLNYTWKEMILNARDYGIPRNRERVFVVGFRNDLVLDQKFIPPKPVELKKKMQSFLLDHVSGRYYLPKKGVAFVTNEKNLTKRYTQIDGEASLYQ